MGKVASNGIQILICMTTISRGIETMNAHEQSPFFVSFRGQMGELKLRE